MEGVFHSPSSTTEFHFAQDSKRTSSDVNYLNLPLSDTRSFRSGTASNSRTARPLGEITAKLQSIASVSRIKSPGENDRYFPIRSSFLGAQERLKTLSQKGEEDFNVPDEDKDGLNITVQCGEDWRPSIGTQRNLSHRSRTPISMGSSTCRKENVEFPTPRVFSNEAELNGQKSFHKESPKKMQQYYSTGERYFQVRTGKIVERSAENRSVSGLKRTNSSNRMSTIKLSRSRLGDSPQHSFCSTSMKKITRMDSLKDLKLVGSPNASSGAQIGISLIKETLEEATIERDNWKAKVEQLKKAMKEEQACIDKSKENMRYLTSQMGSLTKKNENLDKSTTNTQTLVYKTFEEVRQMQEEVNACKEILKQANEQIEVEKELVKQGKQQTMLLKNYLAEQMKDRDAMRTKLELSRHSRKKSAEKYHNTESTQRNYATVLEDQFRRYAAE